MNSWRKEENLYVQDLGLFRINIDHSQFIDNKIYYLGIYEPATVKSIRQLVHTGDITFDIGANIGYITLVLASCVGEKGKVVAIEPSTRAFDRLIKNVKLNNMEQVTCERVGLSSTTEKNVKLTVPCGYRLDGKNTAIEETVDIFSLDDFVQGHGIQRLDFIKIDTDGMEAAIFRGALGSLERFQPKIIFELAPNHLESHDASAGEVLDILDSLGYNLFHIENLKSFDDIKKAVSALDKGETINIVAMPLSGE